MDMQEHILAALREQLGRWEGLLSSLGEERITAPHPDGGWSIKDFVAHLWAWQQISVLSRRMSIIMSSSMDL